MDRPLPGRSRAPVQALVCALAMAMGMLPAVPASRRRARGTGLLATIGATTPFVGLFGTVWGIMNAFVGISKAQTTNLAVVAPDIAEALLATAISLVAAIPAVVIYNMFARAIAGYRAALADAAATVERLVSLDLDFRKVPAGGGVGAMAAGVRAQGREELTEAHEINVTPFIDVIALVGLEAPPAPPAAAPGGSAP